MDHRSRVVIFFLWGYVQVFGQAAALSVFALWFLQAGAMVAGNWGFEPLPVLVHLFATFSFLLFYPGQRYWTDTRIGPDGKTYLIVGNPDNVDP